MHGQAESRESDLGFPRSARIIKSEDFGRILHSATPGMRFARGVVSVCAVFTDNIGDVRIGLTVGKHNVPRAVDRALAKRIIRENVRVKLPLIRAACLEGAFGIEVSLRVREPIRGVGKSVGLSVLKGHLRQSTEDCISSLVNRMTKRASSGSR